MTTTWAPPAPAASPRRPRLRRELALLAVLYVAYSVSRSLVDTHADEAGATALRILEVERLLRLDVEAAWSGWLAGSTVLSVAAAYVYALLHYTVTPAVLVWLYRVHPSRYAAARTTLLLATTVALVGYWLVPTAPPRLLSADYPDVLALTSGFGWWGGEASAPRGLGGMTNQYAAMPSMHVGWAVWCGLVVAQGARRGWLRAAAVAYPVLIALVVVVTGNHWVLDAAAGAAVVGLTAVVTRRLVECRVARSSTPPSVAGVRSASTPARPALAA